MHIGFHSSFYILIIRSPYLGPDLEGFAACKISISNIKIFQKVHFISSLQEVNEKCNSSEQPLVTKRSEPSLVSLRVN